MSTSPAPAGAGSSPEHKSTGELGRSQEDKEGPTAKAEGGHWGPAAGRSVGCWVNRLHAHQGDAQHEHCPHRPLDDGAGCSQEMRAEGPGLEP